MSDIEWFYIVEGAKREGPVSTETLIDLLKRRLPPDTLVWRHGLAAWTKASDVADIGTTLPPPVPAALTGPPSPPPASAADEAPTLNPFRLLRRCLNLKGRFSRAEFAVAYLGTIGLMFGMAFTIGLLAALAGASDQDTEALTGLITLCWLPVMLIASIGGGVRRLHDLGKPGWHIVLMFIPCVNFVMLLYLLFAPSKPQPMIGDSPAGVVIALAAVFIGIMMVGIIAAIAIPSLLRARVSANEAATIGDLRTLAAAQQAYASNNGGYFDAEWRCLASPSDCVPGYAGQPFLARIIRQK